jgi:hypothetical protein
LRGSPLTRTFAKCLPAAPVMSYATIAATTTTTTTAAAAAATKITRQWCDRGQGDPLLSNKCPVTSFHPKS